MGHFFSLDPPSQTQLFSASSLFLGHDLPTARTPVSCVVAKQSSHLACIAASPVKHIG